MLLQILNDTIGNVVETLVNTGVAVHEITGGGQIVNGVDNSVVGGVITLIVAAIVRAIEKRRIKRK